MVVKGKRWFLKQKLDTGLSWTKPKERLINADSKPMGNDSENPLKNLDGKKLRLEAHRWMRQKIE